jgi:3-deoxy-D-manno-octulosonic-acid transferase
MKIIYNLGIRIFSFGLFITSIFNKKVRLFRSGRTGIFEIIQKKIDPGEKIIWFHCASLGEFEQGRPVIESVREKRPGHKILLTFFSPSGFEVRKNYELADYVFYLPVDTKKNAERFVRLVNPEIVVFVKYEFWYHYISTLFRKKIPVYLISSNFRTNQIFFKWYGKFFRRMLPMFTHLFVQNQRSKELLVSVQVDQVTVAGDTRFDRVDTIAKQRREIPVIEAFRQDCFTLVAGSTWKEDEDILIRVINEYRKGLKWILVPHVIHEDHIARIIRLLNRPVIRFSETKSNDCSNADVLIIDNIGMLSSLYYYGDIAYIGGGFGKGIHNILEASAYGIPVLFGPEYTAFQEAIDLINLEGAFSVKSYKELMNILQRLEGNPEHLKNSGTTAKNYVKSHLGATKSIVEKLLIN